MGGCVLTYAVTEACIKCKYTDCVVVCPVDCFHEGENMLVINPDTCIDCGVCEVECPANAIIPDTQEGSARWVDLNRRCSSKWPSLTVKKPAPEDADKWLHVPCKYDNHFSDKPGC